MANSTSFIDEILIGGLKALPESLLAYCSEFEYNPWLFSFFGSLLVGLSGIFPLLVIPIDETATFKDGAGAASLRVLLSFAVGGLLGDVFLHTLPEAWENDFKNRKEGDPISMKCGLWVLFGMLVFIIVEKLFEGVQDEDEEEEEEADESMEDSVIEKHQVQKKLNGEISGPLEIEDIHNLVAQEKKKRLKFSSVIEGAAALPTCNGVEENTKLLYASCLFNNNSLGIGACIENACNGSLANGVSKGRCMKGNRWMGRCLLREGKAKLVSKNADGGNKAASKGKHVAGYLNLMANSIDNFTHGLAVGGSFLVSLRVGLLTTFAILVHEIPHEVGDFAILLKSGFSRWEAAKAQLATASAGLIGAMTAVVFSGASNTLEAKTSWILPFTAGGFLHIALVTVLPDLLKEEDRWEALKQVAALLFGIAVMAVMTMYFG